MISIFTADDNVTANAVFYWAQPMNLAIFNALGDSNDNVHVHFHSIEFIETVIFSRWCAHSKTNRIKSKHCRRNYSFTIDDFIQLWWPFRICIFVFFIDFDLNIDSIWFMDSQENALSGRHTWTIGLRIWLNIIANAFLSDHWNVCECVKIAIMMWKAGNWCIYASLV